MTKTNIKPILEGLFSNKEAWKSFQDIQKQRRMENTYKISAFIKAGLRNPWLNRSVDIEDGDFVCEDFLEFSSFMVLESLEQLKAELDYGNWAINQGFIYGDFAFINQVNGGKEWAVFKYDKETDTAFQFESWTGFCVTFDEFKHMEKCSNKQLNDLEYN